jgi:hypothetical protein
MGFGTVTAEVDIDDVLDQLDDNDLRDELDKRRRVAVKYGRPGVVNVGGEDFAEDALDALKEGRIDDAMLILERNLRPKFKESADVIAAYDKAVGREKKKAAA